MKAIPWLEEVFEVSQAMYSVAGRKLSDIIKDAEALADALENATANNANSKEEN